jgi:cell division protein FtsW
MSTTAYTPPPALLSLPEPRVHIDYIALTLVACLLLLGMVMVGSASVSLASSQAADHPFAFLQNQLITATAGCALCAGMLFVPLDWWQRISVPLLVLAAVLLLLVLIPGIGYKAKGARRWLHIWKLSFQVSEFARMAVLLFVADFAVRREALIRTDAKALAKALLVLLAFAGLLLAQHDLGAGVVLVITGLALLFLAGAPWPWMTLLLSVVGVLCALSVWLAPYRMARIVGFLDPWADPQNKGYQLVQSLIAIGRGDWFGVGLGASVQKLFYLPEAHTDFLFAVLAEELGLVGVVLTLALFMALTWRVLQIARNAAAEGLKFPAYVAAAFGIWLGVQALINIGVNTGVLPTKGLTLPFMSYGRSSLLMTLLWFGLVLRVHHETAAEQRSPAPGARRRAAAGALS